MPYGDPNLTPVKSPPVGTESVRIEAGNVRYTPPAISDDERREIRKWCLIQATDSVSENDIIEQAWRYETYILEGYEALMNREGIEGDA